VLICPLSSAWRNAGDMPARLLDARRSRTLSAVFGDGSWLACVNAAMTRSILCSASSSFALQGTRLASVICHPLTEHL